MDDLSVFVECDEVEGVVKTPCTLLLSPSLYDELRALERELGVSTRSVMGLLLDFGVGLLMEGNLKPATGAKKVYQGAGEADVECKFRPMNRDWLRIGVLCRKLSWSRCRVFAVLLRLYLAQRKGKRTVATKLWDFIKKNQRRCQLLFTETWQPHKVTRQLTFRDTG